VSPAPEGKKTRFLIIFYWVLKLCAKIVIEKCRDLLQGCELVEKALANPILMSQRFSGSYRILEC